MSAWSTERAAAAQRSLILFSAGTAERRASAHEQAAALSKQVSWNGLERTLRARRLLARLGPRVLQLAAGAAPAEFAAAVEQSLQAGRRQASYLQVVAQHLTTVLAQAGIASSVLKGPLLSQAIYDDPGRRLSGDVDLLVAPGQLGNAVAALGDLGYRPPAPELLDRQGLPPLHFVLAHQNGQLALVELHWRVHWYERRFAAERLLPASLDCGSDWRPAPVDELAALLLFYARDGFVDLRLASDLGAWWDANGSQLAPGALDELLRSYPPLSRAITAAASAAEHIVGLPAGRLTESSGRRDIRTRLATRLSDPNPRASEPQLHAQMGLIDGLLSPPGTLGAFVRRQLLPPAAVRERQARERGRLRPRSAWTRAAGTLARYAGALGRVLEDAARGRATGRLQA